MSQAISQDTAVGHGRSSFGGSRPLHIIDILLLGTLVGNPSTGSELKKELSCDYGFNVSFGTIYPRLNFLEKSELVFSYHRRSAKKKIYIITNRGDAILKKNLQNLTKMIKKISSSEDSDKETYAY